MKTKILLTLFALAGTFIGNAAPISPEAALGRVADGSDMKGRNVAAAPRLLHQWTDAEGHPVMYLYTFSGSEGFMLLAADDAVTPLLGYSENGSFGVEGMPSNVSSWLDFYSEEIATVRKLEKDGLLTQSYKPIQAPRKADMTAIKPMLTSQWDQTSPFNDQCPSLGNGRKCVTGCVATAMAQVMNYWEFPTKGKGSISYKPQGLETLTMDFSATTFDWDNMVDVYKKGFYSATSGKAVSTLMKACGYSVKMSYSEWESGTYSKNIPTALKEYFGYDTGVKQVERSTYQSNDDWNQMIYNELANVGPVIYSGQSSKGGHCFVCDGYDGKGLFHINWGWGGMSDGYFQLSELTPSEIGAGGHYGGYNMMQDVITGIMPPVGRLTLDKIQINNAADDSGNVKEWGGYTYRISNFSNILLSVRVKISGGHVTSPLYYTIYETDPATKKNVAVAMESSFDTQLNASEGTHTCETRINFSNYDPGKLYTLNVTYDLKGQRTTIGSIRLAASSGVEEILAEEDGWLEVYNLNGILVGQGERESALGGLAPGVYIVRLTTGEGTVRTLKLHLK